MLCSNVPYPSYHPHTQLACVQTPLTSGKKGGEGGRVCIQAISSMPSFLRGPTKSLQDCFVKKPFKKLSLWHIKKVRIFCLIINIYLSPRTCFPLRARFQITLRRGLWFCSRIATNVFIAAFNRTLLYPQTTGYWALKIDHSGTLL